jgi:MFS transporter, NNP family, nitrate/nitrite transporter
LPSPIQLSHTHVALSRTLSPPPLSLLPEIAVDNVLSKYYQNHFKLSQTVGGGLASVSGLLNLFSRPSGGIFSDALSARFGHRSRISWLFVTSLAAGVCMMLFGGLPLGVAPATVLMVLFSIFYEQACGATYALVPFVSNRSPGLVSGFVSSGGTAGAAIWNGVIFKSQEQVRRGGGERERVGGREEGRDRKA